MGCKCLSSCSFPLICFFFACVNGLFSRRLRRFTQIKDSLVNGSAKADAIDLADKDSCDIV